MSALGKSFKTPVYVHFGQNQLLKSKNAAAGLKLKLSPTLKKCIIHVYIPVPSFQDHHAIPWKYINKYVHVGNLESKNTVFCNTR